MPTFAYSSLWLEMGRLTHVGGQTEGPLHARQLLVEGFLVDVRDACQGWM